MSNVSIPNSEVGQDCLNSPTFFYMKSSAVFNFPYFSIFLVLREPFALLLLSCSFSDLSLDIGVEHCSVES